VLGSLATNAAAVPMVEDAETERVNRPMNWIIGLRLFLMSCSAAIFSEGRSNPSPSMSTHTTIAALPRVERLHHRFPLGCGQLVVQHCRPEVAGLPAVELEEFFGPRDALGSVHDYVVVLRGEVGAEPFDGQVRWCLRG